MVYGRIQPIIATLATGAVYIGIALFLRPTPGGKVDEDLSWAMTNDLTELAGSFHFADDGAAAWFQPSPGCPSRSCSRSWWSCSSGSRSAAR